MQAPELSVLGPSIDAHPSIRPFLDPFCPYKEELATAHESSVKLIPLVMSIDMTNANTRLTLFVTSPRATCLRRVQNL